MSNPFENEDGTFVAVINDDGQYALWPTFANVPDGWTIAHGPGPKSAVLSYIEEVWTDMRPQSLIDRLSRSDASVPLD